MPVYKKTDSPWWWIDLTTRDGKRIRKRTAHRVDAPTSAQRKANREAAEVELHEAYRAAAAGAPPPTKPTITLADYLTWYEQHVTAHHKGKTREASMLKRLRLDLGQCWLHDLTRDRILEWRTARATQVTAGSVNRELDVLKAALTQAIPKYLEHSPATGVSRLPHVSAPRQILSREDEAKLLAVLTPADQCVLIAALDTLARAGDLVRLTWADDHGAYLAFRNPKTGQPYEVPVSSRLRRALDRITPRDALATDLVFADRQSANGRPMELWRVLRDACLKAHVTGVTFHGLRHTGASRLVAAGVDLRTVQQLGGWASLKQLARYAHPTHAHLVAAVEEIGHGVRDADPPSTSARDAAVTDARRNPRNRVDTRGQSEQQKQRKQAHIPLKQRKRA